MLYEVITPVPWRGPDRDARRCGDEGPGPGRRSEEGAAATREMSGEEPEETVA